MTTQARRIDVHHHFLPPQFVAALARQGAKWTGGPIIPDWTVDKAREVMARQGIANAVASVVPGVYWGDAAAAIHWARHSNEFLARTISDDRQIFGGFASLPLPDANAACREVEYALDVLKLDGVLLMSSTGDQYPGDPAFEEVFQELERRKAIVLIHPNTVPPGAIVPKLSIPWGLVEFVLDTTRCVANLLFSGTLERYTSIRYIVSHAGGTIPYIGLRLAFGQRLQELEGRLPHSAMHYLQRLYYDTTLSTADPVLAALGQFAPKSQVLFGSDYPMVDESVVQVETSMLEASKVLDDTTRFAIDRGNALELFPRFAGQQEAIAA